MMSGSCGSLYAADVQYRPQCVRVRVRVHCVRTGSLSVVLKCPLHRVSQKKKNNKKDTTELKPYEMLQDPEAEIKSLRAIDKSSLIQTGLIEKGNGEDIENTRPLILIGEGFRLLKIRLRFRRLASRTDLDLPVNQLITTTTSGHAGILMRWRRCQHLTVGQKAGG
ncbi:hypothetical protein F2P81_015682 [Scophthalmus maximus]|uniref:Uncharacterized protein n=1 Tax=Scophthalmus maximus TaxID=52904 RepID=A0A6A4SD29_SCOMX|nr:hypothetical protein F2P81_015682 [Scophthalmus maximus]